MDHKVLKTILVGALLAGLGAAGVYWVRQTTRVSQPVPYNHKKHVEFGIACESCHVGSRDGVRAAIPNVQTCALCHVPGRKTPPTPPKLESYIRKMKQIPWRRIYTTPGHVRFSHKRHVELEGIDCKTCHGDMGQREKALRKQPVTMKMKNCRSCHKAKKITTDCLACHR